MKNIIGVIGTIGSGKDVVAEYISEKLKIPHYQISSPIKEIALSRGYTIDRPTLIRLGTELAKEKGEDYLAVFLLNKIETTGIISGMRQLKQIDYLKNNSNLTLLSVDSHPKVRFDRAKSRGKLGEAITLEEFIQLEKEENSAPNVQRLFECMAHADYKIDNDSTLEDLYQQVDTILSKIKLS
jgi:dephospho-CoA kinase